MIDSVKQKARESFKSYFARFKAKMIVDEVILDEEKLLERTPT